MLTQIQKSVDKLISILPYREIIPNQKVKIIAHRGAHNKQIAENSLLSFDRALELGAWGIELDIRQSKDQHFIVHHDRNLKRVWGVNANIAELTLAQIKQVSPQIPTLDEVITRFGKKIHLLIELKAPFANENLLVKTLTPLEAIQEYHLLSLDDGIFQQLNQIPVESLCLVPELWNVAKFCQLSISNDYGGVLGHYLLMTRRKQKALRRANIIIGTGFVNSKPCLYREIKRGVDWIFSNDIAALLSDK